MSGRRGTVLVIGGGASGMAAAYFAAQQGAEVVLLEKNEKLGKKVYITGKGRCNVTNASPPEALLEHVISNARFLYGAIRRFDSDAVMRWIESLGTPLKTERGNRVFPVSDHASDILKALQRGLTRMHVDVRLHTEADALLQCEGEVRGVQLNNGEKLCGNAVIIATGGLSYPSTGSTGDGYRLAAAAGHTVTPLRPALVPLTVRENWVGSLEGLSLRNIRLTIPYGKKKRFSEFGEMLFTADGISGPLALRASSVIGGALEETPLSAVIDLKPALTEEQLESRLLRMLAESPNKTFRNVVRPLLPASLVPVAVACAGISAEKPVHDITKAERKAFLRCLKAFPLTLTGTHGYREAVITQGGVRTKEVDPVTMASRCCRGLYLAGELLDLDACTGGYNLQIAWSTGYCAGTAAAQYALEKEENR